MHTFCGNHQNQQSSQRAVIQSTVFFPTKAIPPPLWNACNFVLQYNFKIAQITGSVNKTRDFLSRLELKVMEKKTRLKIREDVQTTPIEVTTSTSDVADEEQFFFTQAKGEDDTEKQALKGKSNLRKWQQNN